jgi:dihydroorotase
MSSFVLTNGEVIDSKGKRRADVVLTDGIITDVGNDITIAPGAHVIDASEMIISPGLVDIQVHLREPGNDTQESAEDIMSGSRAAAVGGMTAVQCMPNTTPCIDNAQTFNDVVSRSRSALVDVYVSAAITKNRASEETVDFAELYEAGARTFTDDGDCVSSARLMREAIETLSQFDDCMIAQHCEDHSLVHDGVIDEGHVSEQLSLKGRHRVAEEIIIARDIALMKAFASPKLRYHVLHLSTAQGLRHIIEAQAAGMNVSTEVAPQHFALTSDELLNGNANFKMNPPLRTTSDNHALVGGLVSGAIEAIATDHAPHAPELKAHGIELAPPGMLGVETALSVSLTYLVHTGIMTLEQLIMVMSINPAKIIRAHEMENSHGGHGLDIVPGNPANIAVFNPNEEWVVNADELHSKSVNSPWDKKTLSGKVHYTFVRGNLVCEKGHPVS